MPNDHEARLDSHDIELAHVNKTLFGNGRPGLVERQAATEAKLQKVEESLSRITSNSTWLIRLLIASLAGQVLQLIFHH